MSMTHFFAKIFSTKPEIIQEVVTAYLHKLPHNVAVSFKKDGDLLIGKIQLQDNQEPLYIQAKNPTEFTKMLNEAIYVTFDFKSEYIEFFHKKGDRYEPSPAAKKALKELYEKSSNSKTTDFQHVFGFKNVDEKQLVPTTT